MTTSELTRRWSVAVVGVPAVFGLLFAGGWVLTIPVAILAGVAADEATRLARHAGARPFRWVAVLGATALVAAAGGTAYGEFASVAVALLGMVAVVSLVSAMIYRGAGGGPIGAVSTTLFAMVYGGLPLAFVPLLHALPAADGWGRPIPSPWIGAMAVALPLAATWVGDSTAFFAGRQWGRAKLAPTISPNKSQVGAWAGLVGSAIAGAVWFGVAEPLLPGMPVRGVGVAAGVGMVLGAGAQVGDLIESLLKREAGVKDSGHVFPGHGGVLDRIDALVVSLPAAFGCLVLLGLVP